jgi:hypothetical protein
MTDCPADYYARRAEAERALADKAQDPAIASIHRELARRYEDIVATTVQSVPAATGHA